MKFVECRERKRLTADSLGIQYVDVLTEERGNPHGVVYQQQTRLSEGGRRGGERERGNDRLECRHTNSSIQA
jgi:hypothetical protein